MKKYSAFLALSTAFLLLGILFAAPDVVSKSISSNLKTYIYLYSLYTGESADVRPSPAAKLLTSVNLFNGYESRTNLSDNPPLPEELRGSMEKTLNLIAPFPSKVSQWLSGVTCKREEETRSPGYWLSCSKKEESFIPFPLLKAKEDRLIVLYMHGGGYIEGSAYVYSSFLARIAQYFTENGLDSVDFFISEYRLAPEYPLPAAIEDVTASYLWLLNDFEARPENIIFMGDSAGGNLVFSVQWNLLNHYPSVPLPRQAIAFSPWLDLTNSVDSRKRNNGVDPVLATDLVVLASNWCSNNQPETLSVFSPIFLSVDELTRFVPTLIQMGDIDVLVDDTRILMEKFQESEERESEVKNPFTYQEYPGLPHDFMLVFFGLLPEAEEAIDSVMDFIQSNV